jgi:hypothetical protein
MRRFVILVTVLLFACLPSRAFALPVFAHRFGLTCQACHTTVPHLNAFGEAFARNGFRLPSAARNALPVAVKVNLAYSSDAEGGLPKAVVDEVELLTGGALGSRFNYFIEQYAIDGGTAGRTRDAWLQYNDGHSGHVRVGQFTLPLPVDPETQRDTQAHYLLYDQTVDGNAFNFFDPRLGIEAYTANDRGDGVHLAAFAKGGAMGYAAKSWGEFTMYAYRYQSSFFRQGLGARQRFGKLDVLAVVQNGKDSNAGSSGGFVETHYAFSDALMAVARYDRISDSLSGAEHQTVFSLVTRPAHNMRFTLEDQITDHHTLNLALLFAY